MVMAKDEVAAISTKELGRRHLKLLGLKICTICGKKKPLSAFTTYTRKATGKKITDSRCTECRSAQRKKRWHEDVEWRNAQIAKKKAMRRNYDFLPYVILQDSKCSDRRKGRENNLDLEYIKEIITNGCSYCGATNDESKTTLDRIDNAKGHIKGNVVASCTRCNSTRRDMPYDAWVAISNGMSMREARLNGLFGDWDGCTSVTRKHKSEES